LVDWKSSEPVKGPEGIHAIRLPDGRRLQAQCHVCTSGEGAVLFLQALGARQVAKQIRPLHMVVVRHRLPDPVYVHLVSDQLTATPELTITSHPCKDGRFAWYLGGGLAESGVARSPDQQLQFARRLLAERFPWCN